MGWGRRTRWLGGPLDQPQVASRHLHRRPAPRRSAWARSPIRTEMIVGDDFSMPPRSRPDCSKRRGEVFCSRTLELRIGIHRIAPRLSADRRRRLQSRVRPVVRPS